ncbi:MAG: adenylate/guanylate cyclase domain-containing protein [bacterium]|nr:adenylate/guanylate cyclase domain-containing protein [bacterium]
MSLANEPESKMILPASPTSAVQLNGAWEFYPNEFCELQCETSPEPIAAGPWNDLIGRDGFGTYVLRLDLPEAWRNRPLALQLGDVGSSFRLYVDGVEALAMGEIGATAADTQAKVATGVARFTPRETDRVHLNVQAANFVHRVGGLRVAPVFGLADQVQRLRDQDLIRDLLLLGAILAMGFYHLGLYLSRREDHGSLLFGVFCLGMALRIFTTNQVPAQIVFPELSYLWQARLEYLSFVIGAGLFLLFLSFTFEIRYGKTVAWIYAGVCVAYSLVILFTHVSFFSEILYQLQIIVLVGVVLALGTLIIAAFAGRRGVFASLLGMLFFGGGIINDLLFYRGVHDFGPIFHYGLFFFILAQSYLLSRLFAWAYEAVRQLSDNLTSTNRAYQRFVPLQFLELLKRDDITEVRLGDQTAREMTVLFTDIRSFTELSETLSPEENFNFLNSYLKRMAPIVSAHGGFVDKYIGDAIMALFPGPPEQAVRAAIAMQAELRLYNEHRASMNYAPIRIGIGIHTGQLMLGIVGAEERLEGTVISDTVNTAARIEGLTRAYGVGLLVSGTVRKLLQESGEDFAQRLLGRVRVKGRRESVEIYELLDAYPDAERAAFVETIDQFETAVHAALKGRREESLKDFEAVLARNPDDSVARFYMERDRKSA